MKTAKEDIFSCSEFKESVSDYIDDEMNSELKKPFLAHAEICSECFKLLQGMEMIRKRLSVMPRKTVSDSFNDKLVALLQAEANGLTVTTFDRKPDKPSVLRTRFIVPAAAALICAALLLPMSRGFIGNGKQVAEKTPEADTTAISVQESNLTDDEINYVMDSIKRDKADVGVFLNEGSEVSARQNSEPIMLVRF